MIKEIAYAKVNLALEVKNKIDGYHLVNNLMAPIDLYDEVFFEEADSFSFVSSLDIKDNICIKAYDEFVKETKIVPLVKITLIKNIPTEAGLAGGSTDAAAVLKGLNKFAKYPLTNDELELVASRLGSDVPFFINPELSLCTNRGEIINHLNIYYNNIDIFIIKPIIGLSTKMIYQNYVYDGTDKMYKIENIINALKDNDLNALKNNIFNDLGKVALNASLELNELYYYLKDKYDVYISGSGPSMFVIGKELEKLDGSIFVKKCKILGEKL